MNRKIVLASASPRRKELLLQIGICPEIIPSRVEEVLTSENPEEVVKELSAQKAEDVAFGCEPGTIIIGADTVVSAEGRILGKPATVEEAKEMIELIQGKVHQVYIGVTIICRKDRESQETDQKITFAEKTDVWVEEMSLEEICSYAACGEPMDKAGAYGIQGKFGAFIKGIHGDYHNVVGLPIGRIYRELKKMEMLEESQ